MDTRRCSFPNYRMGEYFQPSHWPLSHIRSSVRSQDDSSEFDTFEMDWEGDQPIPIPYQQRTIRSLTGRSLQESFARLKRKRPSSSPGPPPPPASPREPEAQWLLERVEKRCSSSDECASSARLVDQVMRATNSDEETKQTPAQLGSHACKQCDMTFACDSDLQRHNQKHIEIQDHLPRSFMNVKATISVPVDDIPSSPRSPSIQQEKMTRPPITHESEPTISSTPLSSQVHICAQKSTAGQQAPLSQSTPLPRDRSGDDNAMKDVDDESSRATKVKKPKQKSNQQAHICKLCGITFTRHFDLLRHNQKHQVEPEEDMARRTCTNCDRVLSRVDATKRHVDTLPESCNYLLRKQGLKPLPAMSAEYYDACREQYHKLAQERKKPKGRKKANPAA